MPSPESKMFRLTVALAVVSAAFGLPQTRTVPTLDGRIVGGENADISDYSYQLSLQFLGSHICGAVTISPTWALTAAHCLEGIISTTLLSVRAGSSYLNSGGQVLSVSSATQHPSYSRSSLDYDIATIGLASSIPTQASVAIPLAPLRHATTESGSMASVLQVVQVPVVSQSDCRAAYSLSAVTERMFCAGLLGEGGKDACDRDSGGPVVASGILVGLVSWGNGCARPNFPGVHASISALRLWIATVTGFFGVSSLITVRAGSSQRGSGGVVVTVLQFTIHPNYTRSTLDCDIGVLYLSTSLDTSYSSAVSLPSAGTGPTAGEIATITGWGTTSESGSLATRLQVVQVPVISQEDCRSAYNASSVTDKMFCAGLLGEGGKDACQGDSGGPLVINGTLTGLVSWGDGCARADSPGVYTNLPVLREWITSITGL
ncbi:hypothetical protein NQ318_022839 [Aromia moschata]|uniref:Peptidase S1 domain-containing protein n=1 Tax=Aromia moschata TaxID=1265417 RepID=A0AAV8XUR3_9CUCU|nr:hypothetical protein NQ318_022839 [Aromia moschata]